MTARRAACFGALVAALTLAVPASAPGAPPATVSAGQSPTQTAAGVVLTPGPAVGEVVARVQQVAPRPAANKPLVTDLKVITVSPVTAFYSQATVDRGKLVTWMTEPVCLLAGHNNRGWQWLDDVAVGRTVVVATGPCAGRYRVTGHRWQPVKGGPVPGWMSDPAIDLVLQTCTATGLGFSLAVRI